MNNPKKDMGIGDFVKRYEFLMWYVAIVTTVTLLLAIAGN